MNRRNVVTVDALSLTGILFLGICFAESSGTTSIGLWHTDFDYSHRRVTAE